MNDHDLPVPRLTTVLTGPLLHLEEQILQNQTRIETWFRQKWREVNAPFYSSVDLRNAGYKVAPVDTNLFPAGFNNLNPDFEALCIHALQVAVENQGGRTDRILLIPENHTRNLFYLENVAMLQTLIAKAGYEVRVGTLIDEIESPQTLELPSGAVLVLHPLSRTGDQLAADGFVPDLVLLNNDLSAGRPGLLENLRQTVVPPLSLGWSSRLKSVHFGHYQRSAAEFAALISIDPWLIDPMFRNCGEIDFMKREGHECLESNVESLLTAIARKYAEYGVEQKPYVVVKADSGTYGMGVMMAHSVEEIMDLNRKERTRMSTTKEGMKVSKVIIQEGVYTNETWGPERNVAEPVVYMIDRNVVGGFYRVHSRKGANENLNSPGMRFEPLAFEECCVSPDIEQSPDAHPNRFYTYGVIARLAGLAAAMEADSRRGS